MALAVSASEAAAVAVALQEPITIEDAEVLHCPGCSQPAPCARHLLCQMTACLSDLIACHQCSRPENMTALSA